MSYRLLEAISPEIKKEFSSFSALTQKLFSSRLIEKTDDAEVFLHPKWERDIGDPFGILGMKKAADRILDAIKKNETILIYGDYDCDGIPASVILHDFFKKIEYENFSNYIPHRHEEGYGFHSAAVEKAKESGVSLIITVDVGITSYDAVDRAKDFGIDVILTDHHLPLEENGEQKIPNAYVVLNSKQKDDTYADDMLCGAGVAFKLVQAVLKKGRAEGEFKNIPLGWEKWLLDMVGISTVADMVPLRKENRALAHFGLQVLRKSRRKGLLALLQKTGVDQKNLTEDDIGFTIAPRINAASRIDHPLRAFELLTASEDSEAIRLANYLDGVNDKRKGLVASMVKEAKQKLKQKELRDVVVLGNPDWHPGLVGLAAMKIMEDVSRPAFVWGRDGSGVIKGSCRSAGVSVVELMTVTSERTFLQFGGHEGSGGFSVSNDAIYTLEDELSHAYLKLKEKGFSVKKKEEEIEVVEKLSLDDVSWKTFDEIDRFAPFGAGNPKPHFLFEDVSIYAVRKFGKTKEHLEIVFRKSDGSKVSSICFFAPDKFIDGVLVQKGKNIDLIATFEKSVFRKTPELRLRIVDILEKA